jgi:hypothetical protein
MLVLAIKLSKNTHNTPLKTPRRKSQKETTKPSPEGLGRLLLFLQNEIEDRNIHTINQEAKPQPENNANT